MRVILFLFLALGAVQAQKYGAESLNYYLDVFKTLTFGADFPYMDLSTQCKNELKALEENLRNPKKNAWAIKMFDASSKIQSGILSLNIGQLGNFDQCIRTQAIKGNEVIKGKYCLGYIHIPKESSDNYTQYFSEAVRQNLQQQFDVQSRSSIVTSLNLNILESNTFVQGPTWAGCFPAGCPADEVQKIVNEAIERFVGFKTFTLQFSEELCQTEESLSPKVTDIVIAVRVFFAMYLLFLALATIYDVRCSLLLNEKPGYKTFTAFSFYTNAKKLFSFPDTSVVFGALKQPMPCLDGIRFLSMLWVILGHQYSLTCSGPITNTAELISWAESIHSMLLVNASISVDTFLLIGGLLLIYTFMKIKARGFTVTWKSGFQYYMHRYLRLTPALAAAVIASIFFVEYIGSGPRWPIIRPFCINNCVEYWYSTLLYYQNYFNLDNMCIFQSWYLAVDMQLTIISLPLFCFLVAKPMWGFLALFGGAMISMTWSFVVAWNNELPALMSNPYGDAMAYFRQYYFRTHTRAAPWFIGVMLGYYIFKIRNAEVQNYFKNKKLMVNILWMISIATCMFCIFIGYWDLRQQEYAKWGNVLHITFIRPLWSIAIGWIIFACVLDNSAISVFVNWWFSLPVFRVLNRLTYCMYLVHLTIMYMIAFSKRSPIYFGDLNMLYLFCGTVMCCMAVATFWTLAFESPIMALEKLYLTPGVREDQQSRGVQTSVNTSRTGSPIGEMIVLRPMAGRCSSGTLRSSTEMGEYSSHDEPETSTETRRDKKGKGKKEKGKKMEKGPSDLSETPTVPSASRADNTSQNISTMGEYEEPYDEVMI